MSFFFDREMGYENTCASDIFYPEPGLPKSAIVVSELVFVLAPCFCTQKKMIIKFVIWPFRTLPKTKIIITCVLFRNRTSFQI